MAKKYLKTAGKNVGGVDYNLVHERVIADAVQKAKDVLSLALLETQGRIDNSKREAEVVLPIFSNLLALLSLFIEGKVAPIDQACAAFSGSAQKIVDLIVRLTTELESSYYAQNVLSQQKDTDYKEVLKPILKDAEDKLAEAQALLDASHDEEQDLKDKVDNLEEEIEEVERGILEAEGDVESLEASSQAINIEELARIIRLENLGASNREQMALLQIRVAETANEEDRAIRLKAKLADLQTRQQEMDLQMSRLKNSLARCVKDRMDYERSVYIRLKDDVGHLLAVVNPPNQEDYSAMFQDAPVIVHVQAAVNEAIEVSLAPAFGDCEKEFVVILAAISGAGSGAQTRSAKTVFIIGKENNIWKSSPEDSAWVLQSVNKIIKGNTLLRLSSIRKDIPFVALTEIGRERALIWQEDLGWDAARIQAFTDTMFEIDKNRESRRKNLNLLRDNPEEIVSPIAMQTAILVNVLTREPFSAKSRSIKMIWKLLKRAGWLEADYQLEQLIKEIKSCLVFGVTGSTNVFIYDRSRSLCPLFMEKMGISEDGLKNILEIARRDFPKMKQ